MTARKSYFIGKDAEFTSPAHREKLRYGAEGKVVEMMRVDQLL